MLSVAGADHIITMDLHASQIQVGLHPTFYFLTVLVEDLSVLCVASTMTFNVGCRHCLGIRSTLALCRFCVLSLYKEVGGVGLYTR